MGGFKSITNDTTMPHFSHIVCLPDLLLTTRAASDGMFDLVREPIRQACGAHIGHPPGSKKPHALLPGFDRQKFQALAQEGAPVAPESLWAATYHCMPEAAQDYLFAHLPGHLLLLSCDMPPWLRRACQARDVHFLDMRHSPLRFGRDLYIAVDTLHAALRGRIAMHAVNDDELRLEAALLGANLRTHHSHLQEAKRHHFDLDGALIYATQFPNDSALLAADGHFQHAGEFTDRLKTLAAHRRLLCMVDYSDEYSTRMGEQTRATLSTLLDMPVRACPQSTYQVLSTHDDVEFVGISSPLLQEAPWFDKPAHWLGKPFTPLASAHAPEKSGYLQVHFQDILAPAFWHQILAPDAPAPRLARLPLMDRHHGRETLDAWADYEKVLNWERLLPWRAFERSGGIVQRRRISALEKQTTSACHETVSHANATPADDMRARIQRLKNTKQGQTAYILGNAPSLMELDIDKLIAQDSFWCNRSFELKKQGFAFRPKYYFMWDPINFQRWATEVMDIEAEIKFLGPEAFKLAGILFPEKFKQQNILALTTSQTPGSFMFDREDNFSYDPSLMVYDGHTVLLSAIQIAFYMGYTRVLVGGVDLDYSQPYFHGGVHTRRKEEIDFLTENMRRSFPVARKHFERSGRILAKITASPHLPLEYMDDPSMRLPATRHHSEN